MLVVCIGCAVLNKTYRHLSLSPASDEKSRDLRRVLKHTVFLNILLDLVLLSALTLFVIGMSFAFTINWAFLTVLLALLLVFILIPNIKTSNLSLKFAKLMAAPLAYILRKFEKPIAKFEKSVEKANKRFHKTEPLSKQALLGLLKEQKALNNQDIKIDLELALAGLELNALKAGYLMVRKHKAKVVESEDLVGPILLSELYDTGRKIFPAKDKAGEIIGVIKLSRLTELKSGGKVKTVLDKTVVTIERNEPALNVLRKFIEQGCELIVAEEDGKIAGFIYLEDVLKILFGDEYSTA